MSIAQTRIAFILRHLSRKLWVRAAAFAVLGIAIVPLARLLGPILPAEMEEMTGAGAVNGILNIVASSMLAVTTFSLSIMVSAYSGATAAVTPRAVALLLQDRTSQTVLSTFIGAFLFSIVGIIGVEAGAFGNQGLVVLFFATIVVIALVVVALIRWIQHLTTFGRMADTTDRVEKAATAALVARAKRPALGGIPADGPTAPKGWRPVLAPKIGYLCHVDLPRLTTIVQSVSGGSSQPLMQLACLPGSFLHPAAALLWASPRIKADLDAQVQEAFTINDARTFDQDPRFGLCVLTEIAERALSPAVNDPGTAIDVLGRAVRVLSHWADRSPNEPAYPLIMVPPLNVRDLFDDVFPAIAHDGAAKVSVQLRLQKSLLALAQLSPADFGPEAIAQSERALHAARGADLRPEDIARLEEVSRAISRSVGAPRRHPRQL
ncbi:DUF2254 domain-containing protein [Pseudotabrizicola sp. L79]|uniref:DUF2254 domain-containing protein n=1 Tax=Pseudotabrizicola sp. L79 TaxID=3118402 RepID=UPI002F952872